MTGRQHGGEGWHKLPNPSTLELPRTGFFCMVSGFSTGGERGGGVQAVLLAAFVLRESESPLCSFTAALEIGKPDF